MPTPVVHVSTTWMLISKFTDLIITRKIKLGSIWGVVLGNIIIKI
jgi:hypothetical protein